MKAKCFIICLLLILGSALSAQVIDVRQKVKDKVIERADQKVDEGIDKGLDAIEEGVEESVTGEGEEEAEKEVQDKQDEEEEPGEVSKQSPSKSTQKQDEPKLQSFTKYDFIPGDQVILYEDFSQDAVGDFPALWTTNGSGEVRTLNQYPGNWLYMNSEDNVYTLMKDLTLPDNFIFEFDVVAAPKDEDFQHSSFYFTLYQSEGEFLDNGLYPGAGGFHVECSDDHWNVQGYADGADGSEGRTEIAPLDFNKLNHVIIWVQKRRLRIYHKGQKALDLPTVLYQQVKYNRLRFSLWGQSGLPYITNMRFTSAAPDMRSKLLTEGKIVSYGIYFDVNIDKVRPESNGALNEIAKVLNENPDVRIKVVGHTDGDGDAAKNLDLSKRRAAAVKSELSKTYGVDAGRIETDGKGEAEPVAGNDTPANKAKNRRVEFIKL